MNITSIGCSDQHRQHMLVYCRRQSWHFRKPPPLVIPTLLFALTLFFSWSSHAVAASNTSAPAVTGKNDWRFQEGKSEIVVALDQDGQKLPPNIILPWLRSAAHSIATYFHGFPVKLLKVRLSAVPGDGIGYSTADLERGKPVIHIRVGDQVSKEELSSDWVATHEMVHLAFPLVERNEDWLAEGMATYVEPIARMQAGNLTRQAYWSEFMEKLPRGLPDQGDGGMKSITPFKDTHAIRRMYWGGALFCFMADLAIRQETHNQKGLQDALVAVLRAGGDINSDWDALRAFKIADKSIGSKILQQMYARWTESPVTVDLAPIWHKLGISEKAGQITFDESAPWAAARRAIEQGSALKR